MKDKKEFIKQLELVMAKFPVPSAKREYLIPTYVWDEYSKRFLGKKK
tara:strand:+ start:552 stop:692 length:141 start_codon:yes stop_codon:yes gene_type:complete